jgi:hypothetical protein
MSDTRDIDRRTFLRYAGGTVAGASAAGTLIPAQAGAATAQSAPLPQPKPIPGGAAPTLHVFGPGAPEVTLPFSHLPLSGLDVEPSVITDRTGFTALAYHVGRARGSDGKTYDLETDIRAYQGIYVASDGSRRRGSFAFI